MDYAALIVDAGAQSASDARIRLAAGLARRFGAALIGLAAAPMRPVPLFDVGMLLAHELVDRELERVRAALAAAEGRFRAALPPEDAERAEWRGFEEAPADALVREARSADLLIVGSDSGTDAGDVLMRAGRPILVVPPGVPALEARRALVAWKDTPEARRAVTDALPLLTRAEDVLVVEAVSGDAEEREQAMRRVGDVAGLLARHGATARGEALQPRERTVTDDLLLAAERHGADLVVAGGYGHARLREWAFGGVTRDLLARSPVCCLLSH